MMSKAPVPVVSREMKLPEWIALFRRSISSWLTSVPVLVSVDISGLLRGETCSRGPLSGAGDGDGAEPGEARRVKDLMGGGQGYERGRHHVDHTQVEDRRKPESKGKAPDVTDCDQIQDGRREDRDGIRGQDRAF